MSIVKPGKQWQKLVNIDDKRSILLSGDYRGKRFQNTEFPVFNLKDKYRNDYNVAMKFLEEEYGLSKIDYKLFYPNLLRNDEYIELHQKIIEILQLINRLW